MRTAFTDLVGCEVPIQLAPMAAICTPELVGAVVGARAMGMISMPGAPAPPVAETLDGLGARTSGPLGFNLLIPFLDDAHVVDVAAARCRYVDFYHGRVDPSLVERVHDGGALAGESAGLVDAIVPAAEVVASTVRQAEDRLRAAAT
jgi:NAD(P)H-dependent flavin oxidoreductase YrpB (nitropropane dioxygenase family)